MKLNCIILSGIPCSGKSTLVKKMAKKKVISCDEIRLEPWAVDILKQYGRNACENAVWDTFYLRLSHLDEDVIIDNTNCKQTYINKISHALCDKHEWNIVVLPVDCPLWLARIRNIYRYLRTGKHVPYKVIKSMHKNFKKLHKT